MKKITNCEDLEIGKHYGINKNKYFGNRIWCTKENKQALENYDIIGPIEMPDFKDFK
jgi:hypothetical protein